MAFREDFDQFLELADFAEVFTWNNIDINAIFDNETYRVEGGESAVPVDIQKPSIMIKTSDTQGMSLGDSIWRSEYDVEYTIETLAPDGTGMSVLGLSAAAGTAEARDQASKNRHRYGSQR